MSSQLVDINADGYNDIIAASFSGTPQIIMGGKEGFEEPKAMVDREGEDIILSAFWNKKASKWDDSDRCESEGHCTSVAAVDWDEDGDLDLLLGDYYGGRLFIRINEGNKSNPEFATTNKIVKADGKPIVIKKGLSTPLVADWNGDGRFDILCGGSKGGVYFYANVSEDSKPEFAAATTILEPMIERSVGGRMCVPALEGEPAVPGTSLHIETCDYDQDGDLDLLVGARCSWLAGDVPEMTDEETKELEQLKEKMVEFQKGFKVFSSRKLAQIDEDDEEARREFEEKKDKYYKEYNSVSRKLASLLKKADPTKSGDFVWLLRRK